MPSAPGTGREKRAGRGRKNMTKAQRMMEERNKAKAATQGSEDGEQDDDAASRETARQAGGVENLAAQQAEQTQAGAKMGTPLLFVPGFGGTTLVRRDVGVDAVTTVYPGKRGDLSLPMAWEGPTQAHDGLFVGELVEAHYKGALKWARSTAGKHNVRTFPYDWRRDYGETAVELTNRITELSMEFGNGAVQLVAHGAGGLLVLAALNEVAHLVESVMCVGTPFGPSAYEPMRMLHLGTKDKALKQLTPATMITYPSSFVGFPWEGAGSLWDDVGWMIDKGGRRVAADLYSPYDWEEQKLGPFAEGGMYGDQFEHVENAMKAAADFRRQLVHNRRLEYPPFVCLCGDHLPTQHKIMLRGPKSVRGIDFETTAVESIFGDGRVTCEQALPPKGVPHLVEYASRAHADLINDAGALSKALAKLRKDNGAAEESRRAKEAAEQDEVKSAENEERERVEVEAHANFCLTHEDCMDVLNHLEASMGACILPHTPRRAPRLLSCARIHSPSMAALLKSHGQGRTMRTTRCGSTRS